MAAASPELTGERLGDPEIVGRRDLDVVRRIGNQLYGEARPLTHFGVIARCSPPSVLRRVRELRIRIVEHLSRESLRRLRAPDALAVNGARNARRGPVAALPHFLERVGSWNGCHRADPRACPRDHGVDGAATHKGASGVVYEDEARLGSECLESGADGVHALRATCNES